MELEDELDLGITQFDLEYQSRWEENFQNSLSPDSPAFVDAQLSYEDMDWGYGLEYNPNGVLWRVHSSGMPHPDDLDALFEQNRIIESATNKTIEEIKADRLDAAGTEPAGEEAVDTGTIDIKQENARPTDTEKVNADGLFRQIGLSPKQGKFQFTANVNNSLRNSKEVSVGPGTAINAALSRVVYHDGSQRIPEGFWSIGKHENSETDFYAEFFTDGQQIVVAFRGTVLTNVISLVQSDRQLLLGIEVAQFADVRRAISTLEDSIAADPKLQGLPISATGHSLGGADAQYFTKITGYPSETFGAPGIINSLKAMGQIKDIDKLTVINHVNRYDIVGTAELGGHLGVVRTQDMHPANVIPGWSDSPLFIEHSITNYQSFFGSRPEPEEPEKFIKTTLL